MPTFHFTNKLLSYLGTKYIDRNFIKDEITDETVLGPWSAKPITILRKRYILFANDKTLLTLLLHYNPKDGLLLRFREYLFKELLSIGINSIDASNEAEYYERNVNLDNKLDRSVLGSINDLEYQYHGILQSQYDRSGTIDFIEAQSLANETPQVKRENSFPKYYTTKLFKDKNR